MSDFLEENKRGLLLLLGLFIILAIALYFLFVQPLQADVSSRETGINSKQKEIAALEKKIKEVQAEIETTDIEQLLLNKTIPESRELDEYIISLQKLEHQTDSRIDSIDFLYDSSIADHDDKDIVETNEEESEDNEDNEEEVDFEPDPIIIQEKPDGLEVMTVRVSAKSPTFDDFIELLEVIERQERVSIVSRVQFTSPTGFDEVFADELEEDIPFEIELTTFYFPSE